MIPYCGSATLRLEPSGDADRIVEAQTSLIRRLINENRGKRMQEHVARNGGQNIYAPADMLADVRSAIWSELEQEQITIDLYRRNLQRAHVQLLIELAKNRSQSDLPSLARAELKSISAAIGTLSDRDLDRTVAAHLENIKSWIEETLNPERGQR